MAKLSPRGRPQGRFTQHRRMRALHRLLQQHPRGVTLAEIAGHLVVSRRSARRYLDALPFDLESAREPPSGEKRWRIPAVDLPRRLTVRRHQAYALLAARGLFEPMRGSSVFEELELAAQELLGIARRPGRGPNSGPAEAHLEQRFRYVAFAPKDYSGQAAELDSLFHAVADLRPLRLRYPDAEGGLAWRTVHPYALLLYKDAIFGLAHDVERDAVVCLHLDQVRDARCLDDQRFTIPRSFRLEHYLQGQFGIWQAEGPPAHVIVDFDQSVAASLAGRRFHPSQRLEPLPDGGLRMHLDLGDLGELSSFVLGFGATAVVREPPALREAVRAELAAAVTRYR